MFQFETSVGKKGARCIFVTEKSTKTFHFESLQILAFFPIIKKKYSHSPSETHRYSASHPVIETHLRNAI